MIMNYTLYLQQGGSAQPSIEEQVAQLVQAAMSGDQEAGQQIEQIMQAAQQGNPKAQQLAQLIQQITLKLQSEKPEAMKCGGKVRAKIKKACSGKKMKKGGEAPIKKEAKGGKPCPCTLHKVGGKLIEVDCNGIPVAKNGMKVAKFQAPAGTLQAGNAGVTWYDPRTWGNKLNLFGEGNSNANVFYNHETGQVRGTGINANTDLSLSYDFYLNKDGVNKLYARDKNTGKIYYSSNDWTDRFAPDNNQNFDTWREVTKDADNYADVSKYFSSPKYMSEGNYGSGMVGTYTRDGSVNNPASAPSISGNRGGLFANTNLSDKSLAGRQLWIRDNADYLRSLGWTDERMNNYKGSIQDNYDLLSAINGQSAATYGNDFTNQQLLEYNPDAEGAQQLGADAAARRQKLLEALEARNKALTFNGKQYADEIAYNAAVGSANQAAANKYYQDKAAADAAYAQRRAQAIGYSGSNKRILARRNAAFDNIVKWQAGQLDPQNLSLRERNDIARQMRRNKDKTVYTQPQYGAIPEIAGNYSGPAALTQDQLSATTFAKKGGIVSYRDYINCK